MEIAFISLLERLSNLQLYNEIWSLHSLNGVLGKLDQTEEVAFAISKPGCFDWPRCRHALNGLQVRRIVLFKDHTSGFQIGDLGLDIVNGPAHLRVGSTGRTPRWKD